MSEWYDDEWDNENPFNDEFEERLKEQSLNQVISMLKDEQYIFAVGPAGSLMVLHNSIYRLTDMLTKLRNTAEDIRKQRGSSNDNDNESNE